MTSNYSFDMTWHIRHDTQPSNGRHLQHRRHPQSHQPNDVFNGDGTNRKSSQVDMMTRRRSAYRLIVVMSTTTYLAGVNWRSALLIFPVVVSMSLERQILIQYWSIGKVHNKIRVRFHCVRVWLRSSMEMSECSYILLCNQFFTLFHTNFFNLTSHKLDIIQKHQAIKTWLVCVRHECHEHKSKQCICSNEGHHYFFVLQWKITASVRTFT